MDDFRPREQELDEAHSRRHRLAENRRSRRRQKAANQHNRRDECLTAGQISLRDILCLLRPEHLDTEDCQDIESHPQDADHGCMQMGYSAPTWSEPMDTVSMAAGHMMFWLDMFLPVAATHFCPGRIVRQGQDVLEQDFPHGHQKSSASADYMKNRDDGSAGLALCAQEPLELPVLFPLPAFLQEPLHSF